MALVVVAAAIIRDGQVLAAERSYPADLAGCWELPGGKVGSGEAEVAALQRECREELGVTISVHERLGADLPTSGVEGVLRAYRCSLVGGEPQAREHRSLRWLDFDQLDGLPWLKSDRPLLAALGALLRGDHRNPAL